MPFGSQTGTFSLQLVLLLSVALLASSEEYLPTSPHRVKVPAAASMPPSALVDFLLTSEGPRPPCALALDSAGIQETAAPQPSFPAPPQHASCTPASAAAAAAAVLPPPQPLEGQEDAIRALLGRLLPQHAYLFELHLGPDPAAPSQHSAPAYFALRVARGQIVVEGTSGVELAAGIHWFLKHWANCSVSWEASGGLQLDESALSPEALAALEGRGRVVTTRAVPLSFYQNVVTQSYSMAYWDWDRWEQEIDWMALQGINMPLAPIGMEAVWATTFGQFGLGPSDLEDFFTGPSFLAWGRMGNIQGYGGPLPAAYMAKQAALQKRIVTRMRELGMIPVFPAFAGFVPRALVSRYPAARATPASNWCRFPPAYCCPYVLDPCDPLFGEIGAAFVRNLRTEYGHDPRGYYIADTFNEMRPASVDPAYLAASSAAVYAAMAAADEGAVWVMQAWLFFSDQHFWHPPQIKALLGGVPSGSLLLLDLFAEEHAVWRRTEAFYGTPFVWTMLHNFGGNLELYGALPSILDGVAAAIAQAPNCVGIGMAPEGIEQNPVVYELMAEMAFRGGGSSSGSSNGVSTSDSTRSEVAEWARGYARRRYAGATAARNSGASQPPAACAPSSCAAAQVALERAWLLLARSVYSCGDHIRSTVTDIPTSRPGLSRAEITGWGLGPHMWYDAHDLLGAWDALLAAAEAAPGLLASSAFVYDVIDVSRELLSKLSGEFWSQAVGAYKAGDASGLERAGGALLGLLGDLDGLLGCHRGFMLGPFLARTRAYAADAPEPGLAFPAGGVAAAVAAEDRPQLQLAIADGRLQPETTGAAAGGATAAIETSGAGAAGDDGGASSTSDSSMEAVSRCSSMLSDASEPSSAPLEVSVAAVSGNPAAVAPSKLQRREGLEALYEWNARTQITIWGTSAAAGDSEVSDYANKEWAGLIASFYAPRWALWLQRLQQDLALARPYDAEAWRLQCLAFTYEWAARRDAQAFPTQPSGDALALSRGAFQKYVPMVLAALSGQRAAVN